MNARIVIAGVVLVLLIAGAVIFLHPKKQDQTPVVQDPAITPPEDQGAGSQAPADPGSQPVYSGFRVGQDIYARYNDGTLSYRTAMPSSTTIYRKFNAGEKIGSFLNTEPGGMMAIARDGDGLFSSAIKIYVPSSKVYA